MSPRAASSAGSGTPWRRDSSDVSTAGPIAWLNGRFLPLEDARISPLDRGFLFADAAYEVLPVYAGRVYRLAQHLERFERSLREIRIPPPLDRAAWRQLCGGLVARNGGGDLLIYLQVSRGAEPDRMHVPRGGSQPTIFGFASRATAPGAERLAEGVRCSTEQDLRWGRCDIKSTALLANVLHRWRAQDSGAAEVLLLDQGCLTEGSASSAHVVRDGALVTPPPSPAVLPGTTRDVLLELGPRCGIECVYDTVREAELRAAPEVMIASAGGGLRAVTELDGQAVGDGAPGPVFRKLYAAWLASREEFSEECPA